MQDNQQMSSLDLLNSEGYRKYMIHYYTLQVFAITMANSNWHSFWELVIQFFMLTWANCTSWLSLLLPVAAGNVNPKIQTQSTPMPWLDWRSIVVV